MRPPLQRFYAEQAHRKRVEAEKRKVENELRRSENELSNLKRDYALLSKCFAVVAQQRGVQDSAIGVSMNLPEFKNSFGADIREDFVQQQVWVYIPQQRKVPKYD